MEDNGGGRTIKLFCPLMSKLVQWATWEEQRLDLGSIARAFELDPATVKLNGYFISRGIDNVSHSVTWRSLLSFFSAKGLPTGKDDRTALIVDGKVSKIGCKRCDEGSSPLAKLNGVDLKRKQLLEEGSLLKKLKINETNSGYSNNQASTISSAPLKCSFVNVNMKRMREDEVISTASYKRIR